MTTVTIRDVPDQVRDALAERARARGQSLQAFLRGVLIQHADFQYNVQLLAQIRAGLERHGGGVGPDAPSAAEVIRAERREAGRE